MTESRIEVRRTLRPDGSVECEARYTAGKCQDAADGTPAVRWLRPDGTAEYEGRFTAGKRRALHGGTAPGRERRLGQARGALHGREQGERA